MAGTAVCDLSMGLNRDNGALLPLQPILFGAAAATGLFPSSVYVPGCPPTAEALLYGIMQSGSVKSAAPGHNCSHKGLIVRNNWNELGAYIEGRNRLTCIWTGHPPFDELNMDVHRRPICRSSGVYQK